MTLLRLDISNRFETDKNLKNLCIFAFTLMFAALILNSSFAMKNPSAVYCEGLNYTYVIEDTKEGQHGICILNNKTRIDAWEFFKGKVVKEYSYCRQKGYEIKTIKDREKCGKFLTDECAVCILENGTEVEVTDLMNLSFRETVCGDGTCGMPENYETCPKDCPSGSYDNFCDGIKDGKCDPDCKEKYGESAIKMDPDCAEILNETICGNQRCDFPKENYETCPEDCPSGSYDNFCDGIKDGKCDPDCKEKYGESAIKMDPDCAEILNETICGNQRCDFPKENYETCPEDCPSGSYDNFCDGIKDGKCDPDCKEKYGESAIKMDPDCAEILNETICGNQRCNFPKENYRTCPKDCPSGGYDNFCDWIIDGKCDPDCKEKEDVDCVNNQTDMPKVFHLTNTGIDTGVLTLAVVVVVLIASGYGIRIYIKTRNSVPK